MNQKKLGTVVTDSDKIIGIITDGDLRRELKNYINNKNLNKFMINKYLIF